MAKSKKSFREFLKGLELEEDTVDSIMAEFGAQTTANLEKITELESKATASETLQTQLNDLQGKYDADMLAQKALNTKNTAVYRKFAGMGKAAELLMAKVELDKITLDESGKVTGGLDDQYNTLVEEYKEIIGAAKSDGGLPAGGTPNSGKKPEDMTMEEYSEYRNKL